MVTTTLTEDQVKSGEILIREADKSQLGLEAALWFYFEDQEDWKLLLSVEDIGKSGPKIVYNKLQKIIGKAKLKDQLSLSDIALSKPNSPLLGLLKIAVKTGPGISGIRFSENVINGQLIKDAYIYRLL